MGRWHSLRELHWRWILSALQVVVAATLLVAGRIEQSDHEAKFKSWSTSEGWQLKSEWDYIPRTYELLIIVDFPIVAATAPVAAVIKSHLAARALFLVLVGLFWYWIGSCLERGWKERETPRKLPWKSRLAANVIGFIVSGALLVSIAWSGPGPTSLFVFMAIIGWSAGFMTYFAIKLARVWHLKKSGTAPLSP